MLPLFPEIRLTQLDPCLQTRIHTWWDSVPEQASFVWLLSQPGLENGAIAEVLNQRWQAKGVEKVKKTELLLWEEADWQLRTQHTLFVEILHPLWKEQQVVLLEQARRHQVFLVVASLFHDQDTWVEPLFRTWKVPCLDEREGALLFYVHQWVGQLMTQYPEISWVDPQAAGVTDLLLAQVKRGQVWELTALLERLVLWQLQEKQHRLFLRSEDLSSNVSQASLGPQTISPQDSYTTLKKKWVLHFEKKTLIQILTQYQGNVSASARAFKVDRSNFLRLLRRHQLSAASFRKQPALSLLALPQQPLAPVPEEGSGSSQVA